MEMFGYVLSLVQKSGCSYEEAKSALERSGGDLLEAMIWLEREGKAPAAGGAYSTRYENQPQYVPVLTRQEAREKAKAGAGKFKRFCSRAWHVLSTNFLMVKKQGELIAKLPLWAALLILLGSWFLVMVMVVVSLFFGFTYSFAGEKEDKMQSANDVMDKLHRAAQTAKDEFKK